MMHKNMKPTSRVCLVLLGINLLSPFGAAASMTEAQIRVKVDGLLRSMTLDEKIGQLSQIGGLALLPDSLTPEERVRKGQAGSILWVSEPAAINKLQRIAVEETRLHIPMIFGLDVVHGFKTVFPMPLAMAASWDMGLIEKAQATAAREARAAGIQWTFAPMVDIARDPRWGRIIEGAGEDPFLGAAVARAQVRGFQGDDISQPDRVMACAKHFAGYGAADGGRDYDSSSVSDEQMWNVYLPPFKAALDTGVATFMSAYMDLNGVPATGNRWLLQDVLRQAWNFQGFVVSDAFSIRDLTTHGFARDGQDAAYRAFTAGVAMDMASRTYLDNLGALVRIGKVPESAVDASVRSVLAAKYRLGLFEHPYADERRAAKVLGAPEHRRVARDAAAQSAVLLRNEGNLLPLGKNSGRKIAIIGPLADSKRDLLSMWAGFAPDIASTVTIVEGIRNKLGAAAEVRSAPGVQIAKNYPSMFEGLMGGSKQEPWSEDEAARQFQRAVELAKQSDIVVLALGELAFMSGELASQSTLELPGRQQQLMEAVVASGKPTVLVLVSGRPLNVTWAAEHVPAILEAWIPGNEGGNAVADVLFGDVTPSGKLPLSWPRHAGQIPIYYAHNLTHQPDTAPDFKSRYWDDVSAPLYPFGHGLSYTSFAYSKLKASPTEASVEVKNTGSRAGSEVVQVYIHQRAGSASRPVRELKGFEKITLAPGEAKTVRLPLGPEKLTYWSQQERRWVVEAESFDVWMGGDSNAKLHAEFAVTR
jgi:beta-glucosidase